MLILKDISLGSELLGGERKAYASFRRETEIHWEKEGLNLLPELRDEQSPKGWFVYCYLCYYCIVLIMSWPIGQSMLD